MLDFAFYDYIIPFQQNNNTNLNIIIHLDRFKCFTITGGCFYKARKPGKRRLQSYRLKPGKPRRRKDDDYLFNFSSFLTNNYHQVMMAVIYIIFP